MDLSETGQAARARPDDLPALRHDGDPIGVPHAIPDRRAEAVGT